MRFLVHTIVALVLVLVSLLTVSTTYAPVETLQAARSSPTPYPHYTATPSPQATPAAHPTTTSNAGGTLAEHQNDPNEDTADERTAAAVLPAKPLMHRFEPRKGDSVTRLNRGVVHISRVTDDPLRINVLLFDLTAPEFDIKTALGDNYISGRTRTSYMVRQNRALAGINGDLFHGRGEPQGLTIIDSRVVLPPKHRATFAWSKEREPFIGYFTDGWTWDAEVVAPNGKRTVLNNYNQPCLTSGHICLYNDFYRTVPADWRGVKLLIGPSGRVFDIIEGEAVTISQGMRVLEGLGEGAEWLLDNIDIDDVIELDVETHQPLSDYAQAISGGPIILKEGKFHQDCMCKLFDCSEALLYDAYADEIEDDMLCEDFDLYWKETHYEWVYMPRTGVGYDKARQTLIVAVVDGYQPGYSRGALQEEFADLLREFGAYEAMELDGGGSATMVLDGEIVNNPSDDTGERHVANALVFFWHEQRPTLDYSTELQPPAWKAPALMPR